MSALQEQSTEPAMPDASLRASEARFAALFENSHDAILLTRPADGAVLAANAAACQLFGYSKEQLLSMQRDQLLDLADPRFLEAWRERADAGVVAAEFTYIRTGGVRFEARVSSKLFRDESGCQIACTSIHDITERRQTEGALRLSEQKLRLLYENAPLGIMQADPAGNIVSVNRKFAEVSGYAAEDLVGLSHLHTVLPEDRPAIDRIAQRLRSGEIDNFTHERRMPRKDGSTIWVRVHARAIAGTLGAPRAGLVMFEDITERKKAEEALRQSEERFRATFEHAPLGIGESTLEGRITEANPKLLEILGYTKDEITGLQLADITHPGDMQGTIAYLHKLGTGEIDSYSMEKRYIRKDRSYVWGNVTGSLARFNGEPQVIAIIEDITARKKTEEDLKRAIESSYHQATHDALTGLPNRASFDDRLHEATEYARRDGHLVALHLLDLDRFKSINDTLGHHIGDLLLKEVAARIKSHIRTTDVAARVGGDEFVVIQTHLSEPAAAGVLAAKLVEEIGRPYTLEGQQVRAGTSIGIVLFPNDADNPVELMKHADLAMYEAKHRGRLNYQFYRKELGLAFLKTQQREQELVRALRENEFRVHYQPQFDLHSGRISGIEALLRWNHPTRGILAAAAFIDEAERARLLLPIGEWALRTACRQYKQWFDAGLTAPLTLNLSSAQLRDPRVLETLKRVLDETGLPPAMLQIALRERVLWEPKFSPGLLEEMKAYGLHVAVNNFGAEVTMLPSLDRFPLDVVKPGHELVRALPTGKREATILSAIVGIAHDLRISVCAGGVETAEQFAAVLEEGCDFVQGYLLSSPLDTEAMNRRIEVELAHRG
jgi:diguanylate cyclase (GGDEF)-like protein/PAS domain S-box-containing protein